MSNFISEGDQVIVKKDHIVKAVQVRKGRKIWLEKRVKFLADELVGQKYGSSFQVKDNRLVACIPRCQSKDDNGDVGETEEEGGQRDNRLLTDHSANQKLTKAEIHQLQKQGVSGENIVEQLVENSATFKNKTEYAQEKYIRKKQKKYVPVLTVLRPNTRLVADMYYNRGCMRICNLRPDSLGQMLTLGNVRSGNKMLVVDSCVGLLVAAMMERLDGSGELINLYTGSAPSLQALESFNFTADQKSVVFNFPLDLVATLNKPGGDNDCSHSHSDSAVRNKTEISTKEENNSDDNYSAIKEETNTLRTDDNQMLEESAISANQEIEAALVEEEETLMETEHCDDEQSPDNNPRRNSAASNKRKIKELQDERVQRREMREKQIEDVKQRLESADMDGLLVACKFHPTPIVLNLLEFVAPSRPITVFCQYKEPLLDCYARLRDKGGVVLLKLTETWLREYQILPERTHPKVNMSGGGGYILSGIKVTE